MLRAIILALALLPAAFAQQRGRSTIAGRYIIELKTSPHAAEHQARVRGEIERRGGRVVDILKGPFKALIVDSDETTIAHIRKMPGVGLVKPDRKVPRPRDPHDPRS